MAENTTPDGKIEISRETFELFKALAAQNTDDKALLEEYRQNFELIGSTLMQFTAALGLNTPDGSTIRPEILDGTESPTAAIMKEVTQLMVLFGKAEMPFGAGKAAQEQIAARFAFFKNLPGIIQFYQKTKQQ